MRKIIENSILGLASSLLLLFPAIADAQKPEQLPPQKPYITTAPPPPYQRPNRYYGGDTSEKAIKVEANISLSLCITQGVVKINGWGRSEVRVYVRDGSKFGFSVQEKNTKTGNPVWVKVVPLTGKDKYADQSGCINGGDIEIDVPTSATINIKGKETTTSIDSVRKVSVNTIGGDITLRNISEGITASAGQGGITVTESKGPMILDSTTGNVLVFEAEASEIGDMFRAKTISGNISLQNVSHRQIEVGSISGSVAFAGEIPSGGSYEFSTANGSIRMALSKDTSCNFSATYGYGVFSTEIPVKIETENISEGPIKSIVGLVGKGGDALLKLSAVHGSITIKKQ